MIYTDVKMLLVIILVPYGTVNYIIPALKIVAVRE